MQEVLLKYAIAIGNEWFGGFKWDPEHGDHTVITGDAPKLLDDSEIKPVLADLVLIGKEGLVYGVALSRCRRRIG